MGFFCLYVFFHVCGSLGSCGQESTEWLAMGYPAARWFDADGGAAGNHDGHDPGRFAQQKSFTETLARIGHAVTGTGLEVFQVRGVADRHSEALATVEQSIGVLGMWQGRR